MRKHHLGPWAFSDRVVINQDAIPHSHPTLTLHCRHNRQPLQLLSTYLHEQLHWFFVNQTDDRVLAAVEQLKAEYPGDAPPGPAMVEDELAAYNHYIICWLEWASLAQLVGEETAHQVIEEWVPDHYERFYRAVLEDGPAIGQIIDSCGLRPAVLRYPGR